MNKLTLMSQKSLREMILYVVGSEPGVTSEKLWRMAKDWDHTVTSHQFDKALMDMVGKELWVTNKFWQLPGIVAERKVKGPSKEDPRQTRMFG